MAVQAIRDLPSTQDLTIITLKEHIHSYPTEFKTLQSYFPHLNIKVIDEVTDGQATTCSIVAVEDERPILISACDNGVFIIQMLIKISGRREYRCYCMVFYQSSNQQIVSHDVCMVRCG